jgi:hypothetical protein
MKRYSIFYICQCLFTLLATANKLYADCDHCYELMKVAVEYKNGTCRNGYVPIYGGDYNDGGRDVRLKQNTDLKRVLKPIELLPFSERYYQFGTRILFRTEDIDSIRGRTIKQLLYKGTTPYGGAGSLPNVPGHILNRYIGMKLVSSYVGEQSCMDYIYLNFNRSISNNELECFAQLEPLAGQENDFYQNADAPFYVLLNYSTGLHRQSAISLDTVRMLIGAAINTYEREKNGLSSNTNPLITDYSARVRSYWQQKTVFLHAYDEYIGTGDTATVFRQWGTIKDTTITEITKYLRTCTLDPMEARVGVISKHVWRWVYEPYDGLYNATLKKYHILKYEYWWD